MALVIGLVAAAAKAMSSNDHDRQHNHNCNSSRNDLYRHNHSYNNGHHSCCRSHRNNGCDSTSSPYAACPTQMTGSSRAERRMERKMRKAERKARNTDMLLSLMGGSRGASGSTGLSGENTMHHQPAHGGGGVSYTGYGDNSSSRDVYAESRRGMASGSGGHQWRDDDALQSRERTGSSSEALPTYEQAVRRSDKSRR